jgi:galactokinase/mevalonate kinase-like predicted kinase
MDFRERLLAGDFKGLGGLLHENWLKKRSLASNVSSSLIDDLYNAGMNQGAWGGKVLGAGGGGCVMFFASLERKQAIRDALQKIAKEKNLAEFQEIPVTFVQSGAEVLFNGDHYHRGISF